MDILSAYKIMFERCLNQTYTAAADIYLPPMQISTSNNFVYETILEMCDDSEFQNKVLKKLKYFTSFTTNYLANIHTKPQRFNKIITYIKNYILKIKKESMQPSKETTKKNNDTFTEEYEPYAFIINFEFDNDEFISEPAIINVNRITLKKDTSSIVVGPRASLYDYENILCRSIVGQETVNEWGLDGFIALLITFLNEENLCEEDKVESLQLLCIKHIINPLVNLLDSTYLLCYRNALENWLKVFINLSNVFTKNFHLDIADYLYLSDENVQKFFFKKVTNKDCNIEYHTNHIISNDINKDPLSEYINGFLSTNTIDGWIEFINKILVLEDSEINKILYNLDAFCSIRIISNGFRFDYYDSLEEDEKIGIFNKYIFTDGIKVKKKEWFKIVNERKYITQYNEYTNEGKIILLSKNFYDKDFDIVF